MKAVRITLLPVSLFCILHLSPPCTGVALSAPATDRPYHVIERLSEHTYINWTGGWIYAKVTVPVRRAESISLTEARLRAVSEARERARADLSSGILLLPVDSLGTFGKHMSENPRLRQDFESVDRYYRLLEQTTGEGSVTIRLGLSLFGSTGLLRRIPPPDLPEFNQALKLPVAHEKYTGLILYTELAGSYRPSLRPALALKTGERFLVINNTLDSRGFYFPDEEAARNYGRAGDRPLVLYAAADLNTTDLIIDTEDAQRILGNPALLKSVREGRVAIIVSTGR
jgi:hypothetical protein